MEYASNDLYRRGYLDVTTMMMSPSHLPKSLDIFVSSYYTITNLFEANIKSNSNLNNLVLES